MKVKFLKDYTAKPHNKNFDRSKYEKGDVEDLVNVVADSLIDQGICALATVEAPEKKPKKAHKRKIVKVEETK